MAGRKIIKKNEGKNIPYNGNLQHNIPISPK